MCEYPLEHHVLGALDGFGETGDFGGRNTKPRHACINFQMHRNRVAAAVHFARRLFQQLNVVPIPDRGR